MEFINPGQVAILDFPQIEKLKSKRRPVLLLCELPGNYNDWLCCMFSTKLHQTIEDFDETIDQHSLDFESCGIKIPSVIRISRLAVVSTQSLRGCLGSIEDQRLKRIQAHLCQWIGQELTST